MRKTFHQVPLFGCDEHSGDCAFTCARDAHPICVWSNDSTPHMATDVPTMTALRAVRRTPLSDTATIESVVGSAVRLAAVQHSRLLDSPPEEAFDSLSRLAARLLGAPAAFLSVVDADRDFYKSQPKSARSRAARFATMRWKARARWSSTTRTATRCGARCPPSKPWVCARMSESRSSWMSRSSAASA